MAKNKTYGARWEIVSNGCLGEGGQGHVFRVIDQRHEFPGEWALKRVHNRKRQQRFSAEIEAVKRLNHPNIVRLVDHSALDHDEDGAQYLVMPIAAEGDLSRSGRISLYQGDIEAVLNVSQQLASALAHAHAHGVIHRDVKPKNILFTGQGHEVWLADFGLCLIREWERGTGIGEVVGPQAFVAPELEEGGQLSVTGAADIYSLGKVLFYMLSGGVVIPRERLDEPPYSTMLPSGEHGAMVRYLLRRMICSLSQRIQTMEEICRELQRIRDWSKTAVSLPISSAGIKAIERKRESMAAQAQILQRNANARSKEANELAETVERFNSWMAEDLGNLCEALSTDELKMETGPVQQDGLRHLDPGDGRILLFESGHQLMVCEMQSQIKRTHHLQVLLFRKGEVVVTVHSQPPVDRPARDHQLTIVYKYRLTHEFDLPAHSKRLGFLKTQKMVDSERSAHRFQKVDWVSLSFQAGLNYALTLKLSEWFTTQEKRREHLRGAVDIFWDIISDG